MTTKEINPFPELTLADGSEVDPSKVYWFIDPCYELKDWPRLGVPIYDPHGVKGHDGNWELYGSLLKGNVDNPDNEIGVDSGQIALFPDSLRRQYIEAGYVRLENAPVNSSWISKLNMYYIICIGTLFNRSVGSPNSLLREHHPDMPPIWVSGTAFGDGGYYIKSEGYSLTVCTDGSDQTDEDEQFDEGDDLNNPPC